MSASIRKAIQTMIARARTEHGRLLNDFDLILPSDIYGELQREITKDFGAAPEIEPGCLLINTANGPTRIRKRTP